jgi:cobalt-zinc-cadmium efflux system outer membrane protein
MTNNDFIAPINISKETELKSFAIESLLEDAKKNNSAYLIEQTQMLYQQQNLIYQKALKSPDLTIGPEYDHNSSYTPRYLGFSISLPLNILNKNQGNIKSAQANIKQEETILLNTELQLKNAVQNSLNKLIATFKLSESSQKEFYTNYELLYNNIAESYKQRQISLIEFIDFFDAYKDVQLKLFQQKLNLQLAKEEMNYQIGKDVTN